MNMDQNQLQRPPLRCYKCHKLGHTMRNCKAPFNIRNMTYEELQDHFDQAEAVKKDREEIRTKEKAQQDFSTVLGRCLLQLRTHKKTRTKSGKRNGIWPFLCGVQSRIPREQNRKLTTT